MKRAIEARVGHARGIGDDIGKGIGKAAKKIAKDIADPKFPANKVYKKSGAFTKKYKDYVLREMGDF